MTGSPVRHRIGVDEFERMIADGVFAPDERCELIEGEIVAMSPIGDPHMVCVDRLTRLFVLGVGDRAQVRVQGAYIASDDSRPEPDVLLLRPRYDDYASGGAHPSDVLLLIEVADSSLRYDRERKRPLYARVGVPETWVVDIRGRAVEVATKPSAHGYEQIVTVRPGDTFAALAFPDLPVDVADLFRHLP